MGIGVSIFFIAIGAILTFAIDANTEGLNLGTVGVILMVVGVLGLLFSLVVADRWRSDRRRDYADDEVVARPDVLVADEPVVRSTRQRDYDDEREVVVADEPVGRRELRERDYDDEPVARSTRQRDYDDEPVVRSTGRRR